MFLAWKEIKYSQFRYVLIISALFLIAYLVFFLVGLANGLSQQNKTAILSWKADGIVLTKESNDILSASIFDANLYDQVSADKKAPLLEIATSIDDPNDDKLTSIKVFGIDEDSFIAPELLSGRKPNTKNEVVVDKSLQKKFDFELGDTFSIINYPDKLTIVGFTKPQSISISPVIFTSMGNAFEISKAKNTMNQVMSNAMPQVLSAVVIRTDNLNSVDVKDSTLKLLSIDDFIQELPGYKAQNLTFILMIAFLILIGAIVAGIFIYVLTMQKQQIFGVMKAQGISNMFIIRSVIIQTAILSAFGVVSGLAVTLLTSLFLPQTVPFVLDGLYLVGIGLLMIIFATIGGLFAALSIVKVDPLKAIG